MTSNVYLNFNGNCEAAFLYYQSVFGGPFGYFSRFGQIPESENDHVTPADQNRVMHVSLPIGNTLLMGSDCHSEWAPKFVHGNNFSISVVTDSRAEADRLFEALATDGQVITPLYDTFWGDYYGMLTDRFGINWMLNFNEQASQT